MAIDEDYEQWLRDFEKHSDTHVFDAYSGYIQGRIDAGLLDAAKRNQEKGGPDYKKQCDELRETIAKLSQRNHVLEMENDSLLNEGT